jgi:hypothetical protein
MPEIQPKNFSMWLLLLLLSAGMRMSGGVFLMMIKHSHTHYSDKRSQ